MIGLSAVRTISQSGVCLAVRHGSGGQPTDGWQDKSARLRFGRKWLVGLSYFAVRSHAPAGAFTRRADISRRLAPSP